ncbi:MAG: hypothetical protein QOG87_2216 [Actinomycetota bacterium]|jgi:hypothetical protein
MPEHLVGPVRVVGWSKGDSRPLVHAKMLVFGTLRWHEDDETFSGDHWLFASRAVWWGSANLTDAAGKHLEMGCWSDDPNLVASFQAFVGDVVAFSEPWGTDRFRPTRDLETVEFDDAAMRAELAAEDGE